jgi:hypothetical protein
METSFNYGLKGFAQGFILPEFKQGNLSSDVVNCL